MLQVAHFLERSPQVNVDSWLTPLLLLSDVNYWDGLFFLRTIIARMALEIGSRPPTNPHKSTNDVKEGETLATKNVIENNIDKSDSARQITAIILSFRKLPKISSFYAY